MAAPTPRNKAAAKKAAAPKRPTGAKVPQDRKAPAADFVEAKVGGKTWRISKDAMDDFELLDDINAIEQGDDVTRLPSVLRRLVGPQWSDAMEYLRDKDTGRVTIKAGTQFVFDILEAISPNSQGS
jgi:hypothetical protein